MRRKRPDTYEADINGKKVRVTVPENDESELFDAVREQLSPEAVASIISHLQGARTNNQDVDRQVHWFAEELAKLLGGYEQQSRLAEELGL
jgi:spore coat polysaccharide biosynthesis protein SpsF (cytidylyltransferase family)